LLYKYVNSDRVDVLQNGTIRFTPPLNTNDIFEVRQTYALVWGPKMHAYFKEVSKDVDFEEPIARAFEELGLSKLPDEQKKALLTAVVGSDPEGALRGIYDLFLDRLPALINQPTRIEELLERTASKQLLLSLSERPDSSPMWAHYADNSKGFVIAFDTSSQFFRRGDKGELQGLHKVKYFDGRVSEIMDDPFAALISKQADWSYEREWRLYARAEDVTEVLTGGAEDIHLVNFPREAVQRVVLGLRASAKLEEDLRSIMSAFPSVPLMRLKADRATAKLIEEPA